MRSQSTRKRSPRQPKKQSTLSGGSPKAEPSKHALGFDEHSMRILIAATRAYQKYSEQAKNDLVSEFDDVANSYIGKRLFQQAAASEVAKKGNQFSPRNWSPRSQRRFFDERRTHGSRRLSFE